MSKKPDLIQAMNYLMQHGSQYFYEFIPTYKSNANGYIIQYMSINGMHKWQISKCDEMQRPITPFTTFDHERFYEVSLSEDLKLDVMYNLVHYYNNMYLTNAMDSVNAALELYGRETLQEMVKAKEEWSNNLIQMIESTLRKSRFTIIEGDL